MCGILSACDDCFRESISSSSVSIIVVVVATLPKPELSFSAVPSPSLNKVIICWKIEITDFSHHLPKNVEQMYSEI